MQELGSGELGVEEEAEDEALPKEILLVLPEEVEPINNPLLNLDNPTDFATFAMQLVSQIMLSNPTACPGVAASPPMVRPALRPV